MQKSETNVVAVIATYRRGAELCRVLEMLDRQTRRLHGVVVVDNAAEVDLKKRMERRAWSMGEAADMTQLIYLPQAANKGC
ncbi:MAG: hypothetical protein HC904_02460, partial [Blastochloris sp.]|nr:hypothetical protein [Blastochloris sp.]